ncbi:MAG: formylglycine-generating enzyme family protein [Deltaproteobacteria bacterium]|nr:formylglycine-generating enzyme family protein [Deltaproteobacteria bacterium]
MCNLTCSLNESEFQTCDSPKEYSDLSDGKYAFSVQATDLAGNAAPAAYEWTIDTKPCDTVITSAPENQTNPLSVSFEFSATDNGEPCPSCTFECEIDGDAWTACTSPKSYSALPEGPHDFSVRCTDHAGNTDPSPPSHTWVSACDPSPTGKGGDMCDVPAGAFMMGCNVAVDTECYSDEKPYHSVTVPWFKIDKYEVTAAEYKACVTASGCTAAKTESGCNYNVAGKESHPINCVDWNQAKAYCTWVGKKLPTEAEWEKAARGTDGRKYPWGNDVLDCNRAVHPVSPCSNSGTATVDSKPTGASPYGAMDMVGNVWEWVEDDWHDTYTSAPSDGSAWVDAPRGSSRVLRGGGWRNYGSRGLRASVRVNYNPTFRYFYIGFRCSRDGI